MNGDKFVLTEEDKYISKLFLEDFEQSGIHLPENLRIDVVNLNNDILQLGNQFVADSTNPVEISLDSIPPDIRNLYVY